jgi:ion channel-forming bestrophin family protein
MIPWFPCHSFTILQIGRRLALLLVAVAVYYLAAALVIQAFQLRIIERGSVGSLMNTLLLGLLLSFRNQAAFGRWWEARGLWGRLTNDCRNLAVKCSAFVPAEALALSSVPAILVGFPQALKRHLRNETFRLQDLPGFEQDGSDPPHIPLELAHRLYADIGGWQREGHIDQAVLWILDGHARGLLDVCGGCEKIKNTPLPPSYSVLLRAGLFLNVLAAPWLVVPEDGLWSFPVVLLVCFFLFGVELIDSVVEEPFGRDRDDLDLDCYCRTIREGIEACLPLELEHKASTEYAVKNPHD